MSKEDYGPTLPISQKIHSDKYRGKGECFYDAMSRVSGALKDDEYHYNNFKNILLEQRFLPAGRVQSAMGAPRTVTPYNCFVSDTIQDGLEEIMESAKRAAQTMKLGGGIGYDFSTLRPSGSHITSLDSSSSGPISFMGIFDATCKTIASAGNRRGAQMGVLRVDHPDIEEFVRAKTNSDHLTQFNISVGVTDEFMEAVKADTDFELRFEGKVYKVVNARALWDEIMRCTWDWAEPGILFIDRINSKNNLHYCETIAATNPCGEQPLPPNGACLLGSFNLVKYMVEHDGKYVFNMNQLRNDIPHVVRAMDNVVDRATYPLPEQQEEAVSKRRMGLGITGLANAIEGLGFPYGTDDFVRVMKEIMGTIRDGAYRASIALAVEKGPFPLFQKEYLDSGFAKTLPDDIRSDIAKYGIRNSHLLSVAPTGTISLSADNVSSGIEPVFSVKYDRTIQEIDGPHVYEVVDYGYSKFGVEPNTADELSVFDHVKVLNVASYYVDSACSKTCNVGDNVSWEDFKKIYLDAYEGGASGATTFRASGKRYGILNATNTEKVTEDPVVEQNQDFVEEGGACYFDTSTGLRKCE
jgi:ribonucleoside-diphosphate reductase alpha chain